jgi:HEAT repeat protein
MPDADNTFLSRVVRIYGKIGSAQAIELLLGKLENQNRIIMHQAILALRESKFQATPANINRILNDIVRLINIMSWNFAAHSSLGNGHAYSMLKTAFESEIKENYNLLFHLLALAYTPTSIANIRNLIYEGSDQDISYAVELLDQIVHEEIKQVFLPVVENISYSERFRQLRYYFHAERMDASVLIPEIITRDFNSVSLYIKASAIFNLLDIPDMQATQELIACLFHPDKLLRESAAYVIDKIEPDTLESVMVRLESQISNDLRQSLMFSNNGFPYLLIDRIRFLKDCPVTASLSEDILLEIVKHLEVHSLNSEDEFLIKQNDVHYAFMIIFDGKAEIKISTDKVFTFGKKEIIYSDYYIEDGTFSLKALTDLKFFSLDQEVLNSLMFDYIEFRNCILNLIELKK